MCKHDRKSRSCEYGYVIYVLILLLFIFNRNWWMSGYSSESNYKSKSKKSKRISAYDWYEFSLSRMHKLVHVRNRCRDVWIMYWVTYIIVSGSFLFSGFNRILHCLRLSTDVDWIKCCAYKPFHLRVPLPPGGPRRQAERGDGPGSHQGVLMGG